MSFLSEISGFTKGKLQPTTTRIRTRDGKMYEEKDGQVVFKGIEILPSFLQEGSKGYATLSPYKYDSGKKMWTQSSFSKEKNALQQMSFITYNVWFDPFHKKERAKSLFQIAEKARPEVICLQEVTPEFLTWLSQEDWVQKEYWMSDDPKVCHTVYPYGVSMLSRIPASNLTLFTLPSNMGRRLMRAQFCMGDGSTMSVGTVHLESLDNPTLRAEQLGMAFPVLQGGSLHSLLMGDFNFDPSYTATQLCIPKDYQDVWATLKQNEEGDTIEGCRYDRVLLHSPQFQPKEIEILGQEPLIHLEPTGTVFPSDHKGLHAVIHIQ